MKIRVFQIDHGKDEKNLAFRDYRTVLAKNGRIDESIYKHYIEAQLIASKTYTLTETAAPDGYTIANSIDFTVNADGTVTPVVMYDEPIPDTPDTPTGDTTSRLPGILMIAAGLVMVLIAGIGRKKGRV